MSFWDNVKKFAQPYADDEFEDEYEEDTAEPPLLIFPPARIPSPLPPPLPPASAVRLSP